MFPEADIPVVQLSMDVNLNAEGHFALGRKLSALRERGVLIVGSGDIVHNLRLMDWQAADEAGEGYPWAETARRLVNQWLENGDIRALTDEAAYPGEIRLAAPSPDHWWPLLYAVGAADTDRVVQIFNDDIVGKSLSMTSAVFGGDGWLPKI